MTARHDTVALTGAAGRIGTAVRPVLAAHCRHVRLIDQREIDTIGPHEEAVPADLRDREAMAEAIRGVDAVVHLGGIADEAPFPALLDNNVLGTFHVLEAARRTDCPRVILASSNRVAGCYPVGVTVDVDMPVRPDGLYGVSKVAVEALGRMYADKLGLTVFALRIGSFQEAPSEGRHLATWLSPRDAGSAIAACLAAEVAGYHALYVVSRNTRGWWDLDTGAQIGFHPTDNAEEFAAELSEGPPEAGSAQGGRFATPEFTLRHLPAWPAA